MHHSSLLSPRKSSPVGGQTLLGSIGTGPIPTTERNVRTVEPTVRQRSETAVCPRWTFPKRKQTERTIIFMATRILFLTVHLYASHLSCISETQTRWHQWTLINVPAGTRCAPCRARGKRNNVLLAKGAYIEDERQISARSRQHTCQENMHKCYANLTESIERRLHFPGWRLS